jgi:uncharacterized membrane protein
MLLLLQYVVAIVLLVVIDIPWLTMGPGTEILSRIQGSPLRFSNYSLAAAGVVYVALAYLLLKQKSAWEAATTGAAVYAVYDFTNLAVFEKYTVTFAVQDTLWGGVLFGLAYTLLHRII